MVIVEELVDSPDCESGLWRFEPALSPAWSFFVLSRIYGKVQIMAQKERKYYFVYKTTNVLSNRYYIGMHSTDNLDDGYLGSGKRLRYSINKYGVENHKREIIEFLPDRKTMIQKEIEIVNLNEIAKVECMNLMVGGQGGRGFTIEQQKKNAKKSNKKQRKLHKDKEWAKRKGERITESLKRAYAEGRKEIKFNYDWNGKKHGEKTKEKIGNANSISQLGEKNSQYGTHWITNGIENKKIQNKNKIPIGWKLGRTQKCRNTE